MNRSSKCHKRNIKITKKNNKTKACKKCQEKKDNLNAKNKKGIEKI